MNIARWYQNVNMKISTNLQTTRQLHYSSITKFSKFQTTILSHCCFNWGYAIKYEFIFMFVFFGYNVKRFSKDAFKNLDPASNYKFKVNKRKRV